MNFLFVLLATILEASGDATRMALHHQPYQRGSAFSGGFILPGSMDFAQYGPVEFATVTGMYVATLFVVFQIANFVFFHILPTQLFWWVEGFIVTGLIVAL
jgi:small multidrug resistance family-3 protein